LSEVYVIKYNDYVFVSFGTLKRMAARVGRPRETFAERVSGIVTSEELTTWRYARNSTDQADRKPRVGSRPSYQWREYGESVIASRAGGRKGGMDKTGVLRANLSAVQRQQVEHASAVVPIRALRPADSPRVHGENQEHTRLLAASTADLPPVLVHRQTMRVIDGMHRVHAAIMRGDHEITVEYFDGSESEAFIRGVRANIRHGLPLSRADREAAVVRIIALYPMWSDRAIAEATGLSAPTVAAVRRRLPGCHGVDGARIGQDGRVRPLSSVEGRKRASELIRQQPGASLRDIAKESGISPGTVRDVRDRLRRGDDPVPATRPAPERTDNGFQRRAPQPAQPPQPRPRPLGRATQTALENLRRDPSLRFTANGRSLLQWLGVQMISPDDQDDFVRSIPAHCTGIVADLARGCAETWLSLADMFEQRHQGSP
jgi:hypothetical protein